MAGLGPGSSDRLRSGLGGRAGSVRFGFSMSPDGDAINFAFTRWADLVQDWRPPFRAIVSMLRIHAERHLASEGTYTGRKFAPLSEPYATEKRRAVGPKPILTRESIMRRALTVAGAPGGMAQISTKAMVWGIDPNYRRPDGRNLRTVAMAHARGVPSRNLPKRPPFRYSGRLGATRTAGPQSGTVGEGMRDILQVWIVHTRQVALRAAYDRSPAGRRGIRLGESPPPRVARPNLSRSLARMDRIAQKNRR